MEFEEFKTPHIHILANVIRTETGANGLHIVSQHCFQKNVVKMLVLSTSSESSNITTKSSCQSWSSTKGHLSS